MQHITSSAELRNAIKILEAEQALKGQLLKEQFLLTYESIKPVNLVRSTMNDIISSPYLIDNILNAVVSLATGFFTKKVIVSASGSLFRRLIGSIFQFGVTNSIAQHPDALKSFGQYIIQHFFHKKDGQLHSENVSQKSENSRRNPEKRG
jgi:hypothetical protein